MDIEPKKKRKNVRPKNEVLRNDFRRRETKRNTPPWGGRGTQREEEEKGGGEEEEEGERRTMGLFRLLDLDFLPCQEVPGLFSIFLTKLNLVI